MADLFSIRYWYPAKRYVSKALPGTGVVRKVEMEICGPGHLLYKDYGGDRLLCNQEMWRIMKENDCDKVVRAAPAVGQKLCPECAEAWKQMPDSPWKKWVEGQAIKDDSKIEVAG